jgi:PAS domain S-box-containing protein
VPLRQDPLLERLQPFRRLSHNAPVGYGVAVLSVCFAVLLRYNFMDVLAIGTFVTFYPAVIASATVGRFWPGMVAALLSVVAADYFFIPPTHSLVLSPGQIAALLVFAFNLSLIVCAISVLHAALDRLWRQENVLRVILEAVPAGLIGVDDSGRINLTNLAAEKQFGYPRSELAGKSIESLLPARFRSQHVRYRNEFAQNPATRAMGAGRDLFAVRKDGTEVAVEVGLSPTAWEGRKGALAAVVDITERKSAELKERVLVHEVQHRARNLLGVVQALATRIFTAERSPLASRQMFLTALQSLNRTQDLFVNKGTASLGEIAELEVQPFGEQVDVTGPAIDLNPSAAQNFSLILHELGTNSLKYGALSQLDGRVAIAWHLEAGELIFVWRESGGPPVLPPQKQGFGKAILIDLPAHFSVDVSATYDVEGFQYRLRARLSLIADDRRSARVA